MNPTPIEALKREIDTNEKAWKSPNLVHTYVKRMIIPLLEKALEHELPKIKQRHRVLPHNKDGTLSAVHYTSIGVLMQLLQKQNEFLRLYDSMHLNDPDEGNYLFRRISYDDRFRWLEGNPKFAMLNGLDESFETLAYLTSFVVGENAQDNLVLWRTYGHEGKGCSIACKVESKYLERVIYGDDADETVSLLRPILEELTRIADASEEATHGVIREALRSSLRDVRYLYKSAAYDYEREHRYVLSDIDSLSEAIRYEYQDEPFGMPKIRHYLEREEFLFKDLIPSGSVITIGPSVAYPNQIRKRLSAITRLGLGGQPEFRISEIAYRQT